MLILKEPDPLPVADDGVIDLLGVGVDVVSGALVAVDVPDLRKGKKRRYHVLWRNGKRYRWSKPDGPMWRGEICAPKEKEKREQDSEQLVERSHRRIAC